MNGWRVKEDGPAMSCIRYAEDWEQINKIKEKLSYEDKLYILPWKEYMGEDGIEYNWLEVQ